MGRCVSARQVLFGGLSEILRAIGKRPGTPVAMPVCAALADSFSHAVKKGDTMIYASPNTPDAKIAYKAKYDNFIGGKFVPPTKDQYFDVITPISGKV
jgi:hypothetical protein